VEVRDEIGDSLENDLVRGRAVLVQERWPNCHAVLHHQSVPFVLSGEPVLVKKLSQSFASILQLNTQLLRLATSVARVAADEGVGEN